jgi:hypothetical protein
MCCMEYKWVIISYLFSIWGIDDKWGINWFIYLINVVWRTNNSYRLNWQRFHALGPVYAGFLFIQSSVYTDLRYKKRCTRLAAASDKTYQMFAHGRWFSQGTPASSTTKTGRHDIAEILLSHIICHARNWKAYYITIAPIQIYLDVLFCWIIETYIMIPTPTNKVSHESCLLFPY